MRRTNWAADGGLLNINKKSSVRFEILPQKMRFRRDVLFSFEDLIVSFGGYITLNSFIFLTQSNKYNELLSKVLLLFS